MATTKPESSCAVAVVLLMASLGGHIADAEDSCLGGVNGFSCGKESYEILADYLHKATQSAMLDDNTKAVASLLGERPDADGDLKGLIAAFGSLDSNTSDQEVFCGAENMFNLRRVAETMRDGGNLSPSEITKPIERLNAMTIALISEARALCKLDKTGPTNMDLVTYM